MLLDFYLTSRKSIDLGDFPLTHDCILKVEYIHGSPIRFQYFSCCSTDSAKIVDILSKLCPVKRVNISSVDDLPVNF